MRLQLSVLKPPFGSRQKKGLCLRKAPNLEEIEPTRVSHHRPGADDYM